MKGAKTMTALMEGETLFLNPDDFEPARVEAAKHGYLLEMRPGWDECAPTVFATLSSVTELDVDGWWKAVDTLRLCGGDNLDEVGEVKNGLAERITRLRTHGKAMLKQADALEAMLRERSGGLMIEEQRSDR
jgi:hypothetical protein